MPQHQPQTDDPRQRAEEAFARFTLHADPGDEAAFEDFCAGHAELAPELRRLRAEMLEVGGLLGRALADEPLSEKLAARLKEVQRGRVRRALSLDDSLEAECAGLLQRLRSHAPARPRYEVREEVARGGMGVILKVWDDDLRRHLAMKVVRGVDASSWSPGSDGGAASESDRPHTPPRPSRDPRETRALGRFLEEAQITGQLDHPGILPVHELGLDSEGRVFFTMPLVRGRDLKEVLKLVAEGREGWNQTRALQVIIKVCEAMAYAHSKGVVHRDLKPANVMVGRFGEVYVMDWGLARIMGRPDTKDVRIRPAGDAPPQSEISTRRTAEHDAPSDAPVYTMDGDVVGTPSYMSPEQALGKVDELGPRSEVYAVGAILYHLLTGQMPYVGPKARVSGHTILGMLISGPPRPVRELAPDCPEELAAICEKAMQRRPLDRYPSMLDLAADLQSYLGKRPVAAIERSLGYVLRLAARRHRPVVTTAAVGLVALLIGGALFVLGLQRSAERERAARVDAELARDESQRTADALAAADLRVEVDELWPAVPRTVPAMEAWLARVDDLGSRRERHAAHLAALGGRDEALAGLLEDLEVLQDDRARVLSRLAEARTLPRRTIDDHARDWQRALDDLRGDARFAKLGLTPQLGLVPLQKNPATGLWEFWHVQSGARPAIADAATGALALTPETGVVLVLVPGGPDLPPFFIARHEVTQGQWARHEVNRSRKLAGQELFAEEAPHQPGQAITELNPVESVNWYEATAFAHKLDLVLPSSQEWEHACRAGTTTPWWTGEDPVDVHWRANLADRSAERVSDRAFADAEDGFALHGPVASFEANPFGLHDVHGNVAEWTCTSRLGPDGLATGSMIFRGGSWYVRAEHARSDFVQYDDPRALNFARGLRLARPVRADEASQERDGQDG